MVKLEIQGKTIETSASEKDIVKALEKLDDKESDIILKALRGEEEFEERSLKKLIENDLNPNATEKDYCSFLQEESPEKVAESLVLLSKRDAFSNMLN